jgi:hypothetical protein
MRRQLDHGFTSGVVRFGVLYLVKQVVIGAADVSVGFLKAGKLGRAFSPYLY